MAAARGLEVGVVGTGRRWSGDLTVKRLRDSRYQYHQHGQYDIDAHYDVGFDAVEVVGSSGIGENGSAVAEKLTGARLSTTRMTTLMKHIAGTDCDVEGVDRSTTHRYQEQWYFQGVDDALLTLYMDNGKEDARLRPTHSDTADP